jgi:hypothetical protein
VHIIGDLHQPLHAGNGIERGGNDVKLKFFRKDSNLHRVWDSGLINKQQWSYTEWTRILSRKISGQQAKEWMVVDPKVWIAECAQRLSENISTSLPKILAGPIVRRANAQQVFLADN